MTELEELARDLLAWMPVAQALITQPDITQMAVITSGTAADSRPPWNPAPAELLFGIEAGLRDLEQELRQLVTGRPAHECRRDGPWNLRFAATVLQAVARLAAGATAQDEAAARAALDRWIGQIEQLPAIDLEQPPRRLRAACPRPGCGRPMLVYYPASMRQPRAGLACLGCAVLAEVFESPASGAYIIKWSDDVITTHGITISDLDESPGRSLPAG